MISVYTSKHKRVVGDKQLTLANLVRDIERAESLGYDIYFCPFDAFGADTIGASLLVRCKDDFEKSSSILQSETKKSRILIILGFLNHNNLQNVLVMQNGKVVANTVNLSALFLESGKIRISIKDLSDENTHKIGDSNLIFLIGNKSISTQDEVDDLKNYVVHLSKMTFSCVFSSIGDESLSRERDVYLPLCLDANYYDLNFIDIVDTTLLDYQKNLSLKNSKSGLDSDKVYQYIDVDLQQKDMNKTKFNIPSFPLVEMEKDIDKSFDSCALNVANRAKSIGAKKLIVGLSGGVDSAATLIMASKAIEYMAKNTDKAINIKDLIAVSMPGFGTSKMTHDNSECLARAIDCTFMEIPIKNAVELHFKDIGHDIDKKDVVFENAQARERTQILLDLANEYSALQLGTADLSEAMLGWCTFSGDQCALYNTNLSFSKTQLQAILKQYSHRCKNDKIKEVIDDILSTPISPELLPTSKDGKIAQKTENINGPYECVDMIIYLYLYRGWDIIKIRTFLFEYYKDRFSKSDITSWCANFQRRFFASQFKRSTSSQYPIATKIGKIFSSLDISSSLS